MITVAATGDVQPDLTVRIALPPTVTPGPHRLVLVIEDTPVAAESDR
jgi:hypothetical protein